MTYTLRWGKTANENVIKWDLAFRDRQRLEPKDSRNLTKRAYRAWQIALSDAMDEETVLKDADEIFGYLDEEYEAKTLTDIL